MKKILVSGGAGFIGSNLVDALVDLGHQVFVVDDLSSGKKSYLNPSAKFYHLDITSPRLKKIFQQEKFDYVYHLAAQIDVRQSVSRPEYDNKINILGGVNILEAAKDSGVSKVIFASSGGAVYGETNEIPSPESVATYPLSPYGINKLAFEKYLYYYYVNYGLNYSILRLANVYGPRQFKGGEAGVIAIFVDNAVSGKESLLFGDGKQTRDFVYVQDVVSAFIKTLNIDSRGEINISTGTETSLLGLIELIERGLGEAIKIKQMPAKLGEQKRSCLDNRRAQAVLDWQAQWSLADGIKETIAWTKSVIKK